MLIIFISFFSSFLFMVITLRYKHLHEKFSGDHDLSGPQKFHNNNPPRIGGLGIYLSLWIATITAYFIQADLAQKITLILLSAIPVFTAGFIEDLTKKVGVKIRLLAGLMSGVLMLYLFDITSIRLDIWGLDTLFTNIWIACLFLMIACAGLSNAYNIIDGFNGLASMIAMVTIIAIAFVAYRVNDVTLIFFTYIIFGSIAGFFIWNYPKGAIFMGDGGAYLIGFIVSTLSILLVQRNPSVSPWFALLVNAYPIYETLFTIWRRTIYQGKNPGIPDGIHFHSLIYRRIIRRTNLISGRGHHYKMNAKTAPFLWIINCLAVIPAILFWNKTPLLILSTLIFIIVYAYIYNRMVKFNTPKMLTIFNK